MNMMNVVSRALTGLLFVSGLAAAAPTLEGDEAEIVRQQRPSYPMRACIVTGKRFTPENRPVEFVHKNRLFLIASDDLGKRIESDFETFAARLNKEVIAAQRPIYPMESCVVSGEELGSMGAPIELVDGTRLVRLCCKGCRKAYYKEPAKYVAKIDQAMIEAQRKSYPLETCVVSSEKLGSMGEPVDRLYGVTLVRLCCKGCVRAFEKSPERFAAVIAAARRPERSEREGDGERPKREGDARGR